MALAGPKVYSAYVKILQLGATESGPTTEPLHELCGSLANLGKHQTSD